MKVQLWIFLLILKSSVRVVRDYCDKCSKVNLP